MSKVQIGSVFFYFLVIFLMIGVFGWRSYLSPVRYYDSDGSSLWKKEMVLVEKNSFWPATTAYAVHRNGMSILINNQKVSESKWIDFVLWNGQGINKIEIKGVSADTVLFPLESDVRNVSLPDGVAIRTMHGQTTTLNGRYIIAAVKPSVEETALKITIRDAKGNLTQDIINMCDIK